MKKYIALFLLPLIFATSCAEKQDSIADSESSFQIENESSDSAEDTVITYAVFGGVPRYFESYIEQFNEADNGFKIVTKDYREYIDESVDDTLLGYGQADLQLNLDIMKGGTVDLISDSSFCNYGYYEIMANKGAFADLYQFMDSDADFDKSSLNEHILLLYENDERLCRLPTYYTIETMMGTAKYVGTSEGWTVDEFMNAYDSAPSNATFNHTIYNESVYLSLIRGNLGSFIDYKDGTVKFDSPDFIKQLEFCGQFGSTNEANDTDYNSPLFVKEATITSFEDYHEQKFIEFEYENEECTLIGYPCSDGTGSFVNSLGSSFSICEASSESVKQGAWEFIKMLVSEDIQDEILSNGLNDGFPINNNSFESLKNDSINTGENIVEFGSGPVDIGFPTQDECNYLTEYIGRINCAKTTVYTELNTIILDEVHSYFNGEQSAEETASIIQNRASVMVSEKAE